jgi:hypothetical protein
MHMCWAGSAATGGALPRERQQGSSGAAGDGLPCHLCIWQRCKTVWRTVRSVSCVVKVHSSLLRMYLVLLHFFSAAHMCRQAVAAQQCCGRQTGQYTDILLWTSPACSVPAGCS